MKNDIREKIKKAFKELNVNLVTAPEDLILDIINKAVGYHEFQKHEQDIKKIICHRNVSTGVNYKTCFIESLEKEKTSWRKLEKDVTVKGKNGTVVKAMLSSTPASEFGLFTNLKENEGVSSNKRNTDQAMNMWRTEAKLENGEVLFSGIRHGNTRGKESSSKEIVLAAAVQQYGLEALQESKEDKIWNVKLGNVQLMSPVKILGKKVGDGDMPFKQMKTFRDIAAKGPFKIDIKDKDGNPKKITLKLIKPILVNFGTNAEHYALGGTLVKSSYEQNKQSFIDLFGENIINESNKKGKDITMYNFNDKNFGGEVGDYLKKLNDEITKITNSQRLLNNKALNQGVLSNLDLKKKKIINLSNQILYIWISTSGKGKKSNPAAIQTRLAALMYLIGYPVSFNCKSGKDRTGEVAAEINDLMLTMEANNGEVPDPYSKLSDDEKLQASDVFDATQSDVIAQANTGHRGLKVRFKGTTSRLGKISGASKHAKI